ncbi:hypothetical protein [Glaciimonas immobilis]|uniref:Lipoprotein n=1 Tax=Glaciimonas immobilis TaxID=728004 RepID=A0A840RXD0_9BURK|nr:hypothetical protein [Glaciimonas immobilis]KAF3996220.1 hypothetical protein HAV38_19810 [Glaciimonas immobilis]MBB5202565.1 hypothetical protein [Glaciimonas immobilis]
MSKKFQKETIYPLALGVALTFTLAGCGLFTPPPTPHGEVQGASVTAGELAQSDVNRVATLAMRDNLDSLYRLLDKLYRRNPAEWKKTASSREDAIKRVRNSLEAHQPWAELQGKHDIAALSLALDANFQGDRAAAFIYATGDMMITAHGGKTSFYLIDGLNAQYLYNAARNMEIATWILGSRRSPAGQILLLSNDISDAEHNLSFEREFGKIIGRIDLLSVVVIEKYRRAGITYAQNLVGGTFLQFLPVR